MPDQPGTDNVYFWLPNNVFESVSQLARWIECEVLHRVCSRLLERGECSDFAGNRVTCARSDRRAAATTR
jgi:hypothetical protein